MAVRSHRIEIRFNGAVVFQRRRLDSGLLLLLTNPALQWGRRLSTTETGISVFEFEIAKALQWGRRLSTTETWRSLAPQRIVARFNGAVVFQRRRL